MARFLRSVKIPFFLTEHGWGHVERVVGHARSLGSLFGLSESQQRVLDWAALFHDVGNGAASVYPELGLTDEVARKRHHEFSARMVGEWSSQGLFEGLMTQDEAELVARLTYGHRKAQALPEGRQERLLEVILRVADGMDIDCFHTAQQSSGFLTARFSAQFPSAS